MNAALAFLAVLAAGAIVAGVLAGATRQVTGVWQWPVELTARWWREGWWR